MNASMSGLDNSAKTPYGHDTMRFGRDTLGGRSCVKLEVSDGRAVSVSYLTTGHAGVLTGNVGPRLELGRLCCWLKSRTYRLE